MELNKSILITIFLSSYLLLCVEATFFSNSEVLDSKHKHKYFLMTSNSPAPSPTSQTTFKRRSPFKFPNFPITSTPINVHPKLEGICAITENPKQCISLIAPYLTGSVNANLALRIVIQRLYILVKDVSTIASQVRSKASTSFVVKKSIDDSLDLYEKALDNLEKASVAFSAHDLDNVNTMLGAFISIFGYCNEAFDMLGLKRGPMQNFNDLLIEFAGFGVDISKKLVIRN